MVTFRVHDHISIELDVNRIRFHFKCLPRTNPGKHIGRYQNFPTSFQQNSRSVEIIGPSLYLTIANMAIRKAVSCHRNPTTSGTDQQTMIAIDRKRVGTDRHSVGIPQVHPNSVVSYHISTNINSITIPIQYNSSTVALFDHISRYDGTVRVFNDHAMSEMIIQVVARHGQIKSVNTMQGILILLKLVGVHYDIMSPQNIKSDILVVGNLILGNSGVFDAMIQTDPILTVLAHRHRGDEYFIDIPCQNSMP